MRSRAELEFGSVPPMLASVAQEIPVGDGWLYEPKWDGFRAIVFVQAGRVRLQSRDGKSLDPYFPELRDALAQRLAQDCVLDGEIVVATPRGLDFDALQQRIHPAASRVARLAVETPASFVAFDLLMLDRIDVAGRPQDERRMLLQALLAGATAPLHLTPMTTSHATAVEWLRDFEGAGLDGVMAKRADEPYRTGQRAILKIKHARTADCVVAGLRWHKLGEGVVGSLLLGLYDEAGLLQHIGSASAFSMPMRRELAKELEPLRLGSFTGHPWAGWGDAAGHDGQRMPGAQSRWSSGKDLRWEPLRIERVCEVRYDHLQGRRFRHAALFLRWRLDKPPLDCRFDQLDVVPATALARVFTGRA